MIRDLFAPLAMKVAGGIVAALLVALGILWLLYGAEKRYSEKLQTRLIQTTLALDVTKQSLAGATKQITDNNRRINAAAAALVSAKEQAAADLARANARYDATKRTVGALEASARNKSLPPCKLSHEALRALEDM